MRHCPINDEALCELGVLIKRVSGISHSHAVIIFHVGVTINCVIVCRQSFWKSSTETKVILLGTISVSLSSHLQRLRTIRSAIIFLAIERKTWFFRETTLFSRRTECIHRNGLFLAGNVCKTGRSTIRIVHPSLFLCLLLQFPPSLSLPPGVTCFCVTRA